MIVFSDIERRQHPHFTQIVQKAKREGGQADTGSSVRRRRVSKSMRRNSMPLSAMKSAQDLGDLYTESGQTLQGSFSAVSKPNFASKHALESSRRDLHNALLCTVLMESRLVDELYYLSLIHI